ncbi:MAG: glyoxalase [Bacteroidetes bacterium]|nr:MAG: glyoxalase [Bacteroidota bacterium]
MKKSWTNWFEIPAADFERAVKFYETIFDIQLAINDFGNLKMAIFPHEEGGAAICWSPGWYNPGAGGVTVYMDAEPDLQVVLDRVEKAGGKIIQVKKLISPENGHMALFTDSEGNRMALHSMK